MNGVVELGLLQMVAAYLLLVAVGLVMRSCKVDKTKMLTVATMRMTIQLVIAGVILCYIFEEESRILTALYLLAMVLFTVYRVLSKFKDLNPRFKKRIALSIGMSGAFVIAYFVCIVVGEDLLNPQYAIPIAGMLMGNTMNAVSLGVKTFTESLEGRRTEINAMMCCGASSETILLPFVRQSMATAILPTMNSMIGMGIVFLPGMMTGQMLAGVLPTTAILYQMAIMAAICAVVCGSAFSALHFGSRTMYDKDTQIITF